jgi:hypothetical protein
MAIMLGKLYDALRTAQGIPDSAAREAAEEVAGYESRLASIETKVAVLQWMATTTLAVTLGLLWLLLRLGETVAAIAAKVGVS